MKHPILQLMPISFIFIALNSCSSMEDIAVQYPYISNLINTDCLSHRDIEDTENRSENNNGTFEMIFEGQIAKCKFTSLDYPCDYEQVNVKIAYNEGGMILIEYPTADKADCRCEIDASFIIENISQNDFILKIYHGDTHGNYNIDNLKYEGRINQTEGKIVIPYR